MSPDGQRALLAGGILSYGCKHFPMKRRPEDYPPKPLPDMFELNLNTMCWVQVGPQCLPCSPCVPSSVNPSYSPALSTSLEARAEGLHCQAPRLPDTSELYLDAMCRVQMCLPDTHMSPPASQEGEVYHALQKQALCHGMQGPLPCI